MPRAEADLFHPFEWLAGHQTGAICVGAFCLWVSLCLILRLWLLHRGAAFGRKLVWSAILFIPLFGWILYAGFFQTPEVSEIPCSVSYDIHGAE